MSYTIHLVVVLFLLLSEIRSQDGYNIMIVNSEDAGEVWEPVYAALDYLQHSAGISLLCTVRVELANLQDEQWLLDYMCKKYREAVDKQCAPHLVLDLTVAGPQSEAAKTFCMRAGLPTVAAAHSTMAGIRAWESLEPSQLMYLIQVSPPSDVIPEVINSVCRLQQMTSAAVIYDHTFRMDKSTKSLLGGLAVRHLITGVEDVQRLSYQLTTLRELDIVNYFVLGSVNTIRTVLDTADNNDPLSGKLAWHAVTQDEGRLHCMCRNMTVLFIKPVASNTGTSSVFLTHSQPQITFSFYYDLTVKAVLSLRSLTREMGPINNLTLNRSTQCVRGGSSQPGMDLRKHFLKTQGPFNYGPISLKQNGSGLMEFEMSVELVSTSSWSAEVVGSWSLGLGLRLPKADKLQNHRARPVYRVVTVLQPPFVMVERDENGHDNYTGYCINLIDEISQLVGFEYQVYLAPDNKLGTMDEHGNWNGLIKEVFEKRADIGLSSLSVTAERQNVVEFTVPFYDLVGMNILMKKSTPSTDYFKFFAVMESEVWMCICVIYFFTGVLIWTFDHFSLYLGRDQLHLWGAQEKREFTLKECFWFCMTSLTTQGGGEAPSTMSGRVIAATWWLFGFIITASYTANWAAFLTVSRLDTPINSLEDLSRQYKVQYAPMNGSSGMTYFQRMADIEAWFQRKWVNLSLSLGERERGKLAVWQYPVSDKYTKLWKAMQEADMPTTLEDAVERVLASKSASEGFAYIGDGTNVRYHVMLNCDLQEIGEEFCKLPLAIALQKGSPLTDNFNMAINKLLHAKRLEQLKEKWWDDNPERKTCTEPDDLAEGINIYNIGGVFFLISLGTFLACATLFFEYCCPSPTSISPTSTPFQRRSNPLQLSFTTETPVMYNLRSGYLQGET